MTHSEQTSVVLEEVVEQHSPTEQVSYPPKPWPSLLGLEAGRVRDATPHPHPQVEEFDFTCQGSTALGVFLRPDGVRKNCRPELHSLSLPLFQEPEICHLPDSWIMRRYQLNHLGCLQLLVLSNQRWQSETTPLGREKEDGSIGVTSKTRPLLEGLGCQRLQDTLQPCDGEILNKQGPRQPRANPFA